MTAPSPTDSVAGFYESHPINEGQILDKMRADGVDLDNLTEDVLQNYDQDHFGGTAANDALAALAGIDAGCLVLDVCSGMGGPSRYLAHHHGCRVTGIDLMQSRVDGARRLTAMAKLDDRVAFEQANALDLPFDDGGFDVVIGQEAFCHIPDKDRLIGQCARVLRPGGRLAFTDILATERTSDETRARQQHEMTMFELATRDGYSRRLAAEGCVVEAVEDLSEPWREILIDRLAIYRGLKDQTVASFGAEHFARWDRAYAFFVGCYETGELGGARFLAHRAVT